MSARLLKSFRKILALWRRWEMVWLVLVIRYLMTSHPCPRRHWFHDKFIRENSSAHQISSSSVVDMKILKAVWHETCGEDYDLVHGQQA
ncbi:hypothetical protein F5Y08DRAFT_297362 [Xylaria arbuscula]|nr:hypothetical protein F5Y08DRAFT_297362 [Xylaria arbuscula]